MEQYFPLLLWLYYLVRHGFIPLSQLFLILKRPLSFNIWQVSICAINLCQRFGLSLVPWYVHVQFELWAYRRKYECFLLQSS